MNWRWKIAQAAEIRWWQNYLRNKPKAEYLQWKENYWLDLLDRLDLKLRPDEHILDAGCGPAGIFMVLKGQKVDALDPLLEAYENRLAHFRPAAYPWVDFHPSSIENIVLPRSYNMVFCLNAINHVQNLELSLDKLVSALEKGGHFILSVDAHNFGIFKKLFRLFPGDILHPHQYDLGEYREMLHSRSLKLQQCLKLKKEFFFDYYLMHFVKS